MKKVRGCLDWSSPVGGALRRAAISSLCLASVLVGGCHKKEKAPPPPPPMVETMQVVARDMPVTSEYVAQTQSSQQVNIQARVSGFLEKRVYTEGSLVKAGDVLFSMDKKPFQVKVDSAEAALAKQKAALENARLNLERTKPLTAKNALSKKDLDDATGAYESAAAAVEMSKSQLQSEKLNLSYCTITSPVTGITGAAQQQEGAYINMQNSLLTTVSVLSPIWVNFSLSENEFKAYREQIAKGQIRPPKDRNYVIEVVQVDGTVFPHTGRITFTDPSYNAQTGTFLIRASVNNPNGALRPNQYVRARVRGAVRPNAVVVPQRAVQQGAKGHFVWVINKESKAELRPVVMGELVGDDWFVTEGLKTGDQVVVDGGLTLRPDAPVTVKSPTLAPQSGSPKAAAPATPAKKAN